MVSWRKVEMRLVMDDGGDDGKEDGCCDGEIVVLVRAALKLA
jgi:hypothetical protein